jgi:predicted lipoprotein with Yx(FWY)xxD motif
MSMITVGGPTMTHRSWKQTISGIALAASAMLALGAGVVVAGPAGAATTSKSKVIGTAKVPDVGVILVDAQGHALYVHTDDNSKAVECTGACATAWPPLTVTAGTKVQAPKGLKGVSTMGADHQVASHGLPLYRFSGDSAPKQAKGDGVNAFGGTWHVATAKAAQSKTTATTNAGTGGVSF